MSVTDPKTYYWVGGATGTTAASRFDWNVAANWRVKINDLIPASDTNLKTPDVWPIGGDYVYLGYGREFFPSSSSNNAIKSPLLFGGFSGSGNTGCWICNGETGSGFSGASGTTFQAKLIGIDINWYPYSIVGGGLTGNDHRSYLSAPVDLSTMNVAGMNQSFWSALGATATSRQTSLKVKTANFNLSSFNFGSDSASFTGPDVYVDFVDCFDNINPSGSTGYITTSVVVGNNTNASNYIPNQKTNFWLSGCKLASFIKKDNPIGITVTTPIGIYGKNVKIAEVLLPTFSDVVFDSDCLIGKLWQTTENYKGIEEYFTYFTQPTIRLSGTYKYYNALRSLGLPGTTLQQDESEIQYINSNVPGATALNPIIVFGGLSGGKGITFSANEISIYQPGEGGPANPGIYPQITSIIASRASIGTMHLTNSMLISDMKAANDQIIQMTSLILGDNGTINFASDNNFNNWRFGVALASSSGLTLNGGIQFMSPNSKIIGDPGVRLINYGYSTGRDFRNNKTIDTSTTYTSPEAL